MFPVMHDKAAQHFYILEPGFDPVIVQYARESVPGNDRGCAALLGAVIRWEHVCPSIKPCGRDAQRGSADGADRSGAGRCAAAADLPGVLYEMMLEADDEPRAPARRDRARWKWWGGRGAKPTPNGD